MEAITSKLQSIVTDYSQMMKNITEEEFGKKPYPNKWSKKEILGHTIDSAQNNIRRFIVAQYETTPFIIYKQDDWVAISNYQHAAVRDMIELWSLLNKHICNILNNTNPEAAMRNCETNDGAINTIEWLARDYVKHLLHHLHQVLELEEIKYP
jgi:hypothetical protein